MLLRYFTGRLRSTSATRALLTAAILLPASAATISIANAQSATTLPPVTVEKPKPKPKTVAKPKRERAAPATGEARTTQPAAGEEAVPVAPAETKGLARPATTTTVQGSELAAKTAATSDTTQLLNGVPGVTSYSGGGVSNLPVINGLNDDRVKVLVDGAMASSACANHMNPPLSYVSPGQVKKIDVYAGITPVSVGGDSIGGTIVVETTGPEFAKSGEGTVTHGLLSGYYRSNGNVTGATAIATAATSNVAISYAGAYAHSDNYKGGDGVEVGSTSYEAYNHKFSLAFRDNTGLLIVDATLQKIPYQGYVNQWMDMNDNDAWSVNSRYEKKMDWGKLYFQAYYNHVDHFMEFMPDKKNGRQAMNVMPDMPMYTEGETMGYKVKADIALSGRDTLRVGNELSRTTLDDWWPPVMAYNPDGTPKTGVMCCDTFWNINGGERTQLATFIEWERKWTPHWTTQFGLRNDIIWMDTGNVQGYNNATLGFFPYGVDANNFNARDHSKTDVNFDMTALVRYEPETTSLYEFGYARKTRSPNLYERYTWSSHPMAESMIGWYGDSNGYVGDIDLKPEVAHTLSVTAAWHDRQNQDWQLKVTPYFTYVEDYIGVIKTRDNCPNNTAGHCNFLPTGDHTNANLKFSNHDAILYGLNLSGSKLLANTVDYGRFTFTGLVSYVHGENAETGDPLYHMMPLNARLALQHKLGHWTNSIELDLVGDKDLVDPVRKELPSAGYALVNLRSSYERDNLRVDFGVENVFNQKYDLPLGGVDIGTQPTYRHTENGGWVYPDGAYPVGNVAGMGRSFYAGLTLKF